MDINEIAREFSAALGFTVKAVDMGVQEWAEKELIPKISNEHVQKHIQTMAQLHREGRYDRMVNTFETVTGTKSTSIQDWVKENSKSFT